MLGKFIFDHLIFCLQKRFNESQRLAICTASQMILGDPRFPKIGLLHGPPGTGKSSTVVAIVEKVLTVSIFNSFLINNDFFSSH